MFPYLLMSFELIILFIIYITKINSKIGAFMKYFSFLTSVVSIIMLVLINSILSWGYFLLASTVQFVFIILFFIVKEIEVYKK